jgi:hypothetical protein
MDRLLRAVLKPDSHAQAGECPDPGVLAAYVEGTVSPQEQAALDAHIVECGRCQDTLAVLARDDSPQEAETAGARWFTWVTRPRLRWLVPITAVATVAAFFLATRPVIAPGGLTPPEEVTQMAQATPQEAPVSPPPSPVQAGGEVKRDKSIAPPSAAIEVAKLDKFATSPTKPSAESALKEEPARRQSNPASSVKQVADAATVPSAVGQAAVDKKAAGEAAAGFAERVATDENRARAAAEPAATKFAAVPAATDVSAGTGAAPKKAAADAVREVPVTVSGREELRNELRRGLQASPRTVEAPGGSVRWRFASGGQIWRSADAGSTWHSQPSGVSADLFAGSAPSPATCWVVGAAGTVLLTRDGERWERRPFPLAVDLAAVLATNARNATVTTRDGRQFVTLDGGATWIPR